MNRPILATIVTQNLKDNLIQVKNLSNQRFVWAVVKANAYGHSLRAAFIGFAEADGLALLDLQQVLELREMGWHKRILLLEGIFSEEELKQVHQTESNIVVHHFLQLEWIEQYVSSLSLSEAEQFKSKVEIWLKLNSGMNRLGFKSGEYGLAYNHLLHSGYKVHHLTHFANADDEKIAPTVADQWEIFEHTTQWMEGYRSAANSSAILNYPDVHADWVRPGILLYGASPTGKYHDIAHLKFKPGMTLSSEIISIQEIGSGDSVGYGSQFVAKRNTRVGIVACGYADGYPRHAKEGTPVWVQFSNDEIANLGGVRVPLIGRVSMDMITIDLSSVPQANIGTKVELWGNNVPIDDVAMYSDTVGYELMCAVTQRVPLKVI
ncbi:alanine racemase [Polynucleobacter kasalickyi]|uniref:Alanine racemase n=1 Tax=Polynucleobacter kasalickyi TaxID=1938817 RepID=A0A1W2BHP6_9BURK|nr:alanine racemase [Polynucleobacter kasalickyi]SMC72469.1 alanine racemase [Polynucleobacter kasalickyi]